jgi:hypothetical protein
MTPQPQSTQHRQISMLQTTIPNRANAVPPSRRRIYGKAFAKEE